MSIKSTPFGATRLTGDDAKRFLEQLNAPAPAAAISSAASGRVLLREYHRGLLPPLPKDHVWNASLLVPLYTAAQMMDYALASIAGRRLARTDGAAENA